MRDRTSVAPTSTASPPAVLLGGDLNALSAARTLGRLGIAVHALPDAPDSSPVQGSRYLRNAKSWSAFENVDRMEDAWLDYLVRARSEIPGAVVLPCSDDALEFMVHHRKDLLELGYVLIEFSDGVLDMLDKEKMYAIADKAGLATPTTYAVDSVEALERIADDLTFPCALKPVYSHQFRRHFPGKKAFVATRLDELEASLRNTQSTGLRMLVTEIIPGADDEFCSYYTYVDENGECLVHFTKRKLRQFPVGFGHGTYHMTRWEPEAARLGAQFATSSGLRGLVVLEFKRDARDGELKFIESNPRLTTGNELVRRAGVDFVRMAYDKALGRPVDPPSGFREGLYQWHPFVDWRAFRQYRSLGQTTSTRWIASLLHRQEIPWIARDDLGPALHKVAEAGRRFGGRLPASRPVG
jgi:predicted ATP-grasp superfamily ATP-dependent carboligase